MEKSEDEYEAASGTVLIDYLDKILSNYIDLTTKQSELIVYRDRFEKINSKIIIKYKDSSNYQEINMVDVINDDESSFQFNLICSNDKSDNINGNAVYVKQVCELNVSKDMDLKQSCIGIKSGEQEECVSGARTQLNGYKSVYPSLNEKGGYVSVNIESADFFGTEVKLDGEKVDKIDGIEKYRCDFSIGDPENDIFRQIDVSDPFVKEYSNNQRKVGKNYSNSKYNFEKIIKSDIWSNQDNYEYKYSLSKTNVSLIKSNTSSTPNSYLGDNCYITSNNKYVCSFIRDKDESEGNNQNFFSNVSIK